MIIQAVLLTAKQGIPFRSLREQDSSNNAGKTTDTESTMQRGNFLTITNAFATSDAALMEHLAKVKHFMKHFIRKI